MNKPTEYVLYFKGEEPSSNAVNKIAALSGVTLLRNRTNKLLLVSCETDCCPDLEATGAQQGWTVSVQRTYRLA